jgi:hypothetical protein
MSRAHLFQTCALVLMLGCLPSCKTVEPVFVPPRIDCAASDTPKAKRPVQPALGEKSVVLWQLFATQWQEFAFDVLSQRIETAQCLQDLREKGVIK